VRVFPKDLRVAAGLAAALLTMGASWAAAADGDPATQAAIPVPSTELRIVGGSGVGAEAAQSLFGHRLRLDAGVHSAFNGLIGEGAAQVRLLGSAANGLWLRGGYLYQRMALDCLTDTASAWDAGLAYRKRWAGGSLFAAEAGLETVSRPRAIGCNDSGLDARSDGVRFSLGGQYALTRGLGIYGRVGARTGEHLLEIGILPEIWLGVAFEL